MENRALQCFDQIKAIVSEVGGRIEVNRLLEKLAEKGCNVDGESIIKITVNEGGYTPKVEACPEREGCNCELEALFTVRKEGNDSIVEIYNPKKHGWWENGRMVRPPSARKEPPSIESLNLNNYWHHLTLDCYFSWIKELYGENCLSVNSKLKRFILQEREELINSVNEGNVEKFTNISLKLLNKSRSLYSKYLIPTITQGEITRSLRLSFNNLTQNCFNKIFALLKEALDIDETNYIVKLRNLKNLIDKLSSDTINCPYFKTTAISILLTFVNPQFFMPLCDLMTSYTIATTINEIKNIVPKINQQSEIKQRSCTHNGYPRLVGSSVVDSGSIECVSELFIVLNYFRLKANIPTLFELFCPLVTRTKEEFPAINLENSSQITNGGNNMNEPKNIVLYGPPGTGKTYKAREKAKRLSNGRSENVKFITFHPSFAYENFIEGIWPEVKNGQINYTIKDGILKELSIEAMWNALVEKNAEEADYKAKKEEVITALKKIQNGEANEDELFNFEDANNFVLIIDEINRGNIPSIFGELISLIEENKRLGESEALITTLPYSREPFAVPKNLHIIGTMNTTDRSVIIMDAALRRRFHFEEIAPSPDLLDELFDEDEIIIEGVNVKKLLEKINERITKIPYLGRDYQIGHSYFLELRENGSLEKLVEILRKKVLPLLQEYFHGRWQDLNRVLGNDWKKFIDETGRITLEPVEDLSNRENIISLIKSVYEERNQNEGTDEDNN